MKEKELIQRENLLERIEGYFGSMPHLHKLTTIELMKIANFIKFSDDAIAEQKRTIKKR